MEEVRWLDEEETRIWRFFVEARARIAHHLDQGLKRDAEMSLDDYEVLVVLSEAPDHRMRMTAMSERLIHSQSRLTHRIDRLVERGWMRREQCPKDRRGMLGVITPAGLAMIEATAPAHVGRVRELLIDLIEPEERKMIAEVLERVATRARGRHYSADAMHWRAR